MYMPRVRGYTLTVGTWSVRDRGVRAGYGTRVGREGLYRVPTDAARGEAADSEAGPVSPCKGAGVGGQQARASGSQNPPSGPGRYGSLVLGPSSGKCRLWANRGEI